MPVSFNPKVTQLVMLIEYSHLERQRNDTYHSFHINGDRFLSHGGHLERIVSQVSEKAKSHCSSRFLTNAYNSGINRTNVTFAWDVIYTHVFRKNDASCEIRLPNFDISTFSVRLNALLL